MADRAPTSFSQKSPGPPRIRAYREFLTPLFHRRFVSAALISLGICYINALILGWQTSSEYPTCSQTFWRRLMSIVRWILFSSLVRAGLLFVAAVIVFLLRISQLRFQPRHYDSPFKGFVALASEIGTYQVFFSYIFSAWIFSEIHIHSAPYEADLGWVANGELYERLRLNEKVIYLRSHAFVVALVQAFLHLKDDYSCMPLPVYSISEIDDQSARKRDSIRSKLETLIPGLYRKTLECSAGCALLAPIIYLPIRPWAWTWSLSFARLVWNIPESSEPDIIPPFHWTILLRTLLQAALLFMLWQACNSLFTLFVAEAPIKRGDPLSSGSKDPNGSLINGLQSKKRPVHSYALWELDLIIRNHAVRRKSILTEIDRQGDSAWSHVFSVCIGNLKSVSERITGPVIASPPPFDPKSSPSLPRIAPPLKPGPVTESYRPKGFSSNIATFVGSQARSVGAVSAEDQLNLSPHVKKYLGEARDKLLTKQHQKLLSTEELEASAHSFMMHLLSLRVPTTPFLNGFQPGMIFQETFIRRVKGIIFGEKVDDRINIIRSADILTLLLVASITEDTYGVVSRNVPEIWQTFIKTIEGVEKLLQGDRSHWTDVNFNKTKKKDADIEEILLHLKTGLGKLIETFSGDASARGLSPSDIQNARKAAAVHVS